MGYFYFDESIRTKGAYIIGAFIYSKTDLSSNIYLALSESGINPKIHEFKSSSMMVSNPEQVKARTRFRQIIKNVRIGCVVAPMSERTNLDSIILKALNKIIYANNLGTESHDVYFDEGIPFNAGLIRNFNNENGLSCHLCVNQDSRIIGGIQLADYAAHSMSVMLAEKLGLITKFITDAEGTYKLGFELWAGLRYSFFMAPPRVGSPDYDAHNLNPNYDVKNYGLYIVPTCDEKLKTSALDLFGTCYLGCIH